MLMCNPLSIVLFELMYVLNLVNERTENEFMMGSSINMVTRIAYSSQCLSACLSACMWRTCVRVLECMCDVPHVAPGCCLPLRAPRVPWGRVCPQTAPGVPSLPWGINGLFMGPAVPGSISEEREQCKPKLH